MWRHAFAKTVTFLSIGWGATLVTLACSAPQPSPSAPDATVDGGGGASRPDARSRHDGELALDLGLGLDAREEPIPENDAGACATTDAGPLQIEDGGMCPPFEAGACPAFDAAVCTGAAGGEEVAGGLTMPSGLAIDSSNAYWESGNAIMAARKTGGAATVLAGPIQLSRWGGEVSIATDSTHVYWTDVHAVLSVPKSGGSPTLLSLNPYGSIGAPAGLFATSTELFWAWGWGALKGAYGGGAASVPAGGGCAAGLLNAPWLLRAMAVDDTTIYLGGRMPSVVAIARRGGPIALSSPSSDIEDQPYGLAVDDTSVYWTSWDALRAIGRVYKTPKHGCGGESLACGTWDPGPMATDGKYVYWAGIGTQNVVLKVPIGGGPTTAVACTRAGPYGITAMAIDDTDVYWLDYDAGSLLRARK